MSSAADSSPRIGIGFARAKLNLFLRVLSREASGYHQIETLFCLIELADEVEISLRQDGHVTLDVRSPPEDASPPPDLGPVAANIVYRAALAFQHSAGITAGADIRLTKRIPVGGGLGGGSSNAAATLDVLNDLHGAPLPRQQLIEVGAQLGSDVPFFTSRAICALAQGRGERIEPVAALPPAPVLLALPPYAVATAAAYRALALRRGNDYATTATSGMVAPTGWHDVAAMAVNDFEAVIFPDMPLLAQLQHALAQHGALFARMTGTGSTVFAIFDDVLALRGARAKLSAQFPTTRFVETRTAML